MANSHASSSIPVRPTEILDPYPERPTSASGVRLHTRTTPAPRRNEPPASARRAHYPFAASIPLVAPSTRRMRLPIASTALNAFGQAALGASIAFGTVDPAIGAAAAVGWMLCGLALIVAQCVTNASSR